MAQIATIIYLLGILGLFAMEQDPRNRASNALWIPIIWLLINASRPVSMWLQIAPPSSEEQYLEGSPLDRALYVFLELLAVFVLAGRTGRVKEVLSRNKALVCFFLVCLMGTLWSDHPLVSFKRWIKLLGDLAMVLVVVTDKSVFWAVRTVLRAIGFILIPSSILLIKYYPDMSRYYSRWEGKMFVSGVAEDKNMLGMTCLVVGLGTIWQVLSILHEMHRAGAFRRLSAHGIILLLSAWLLWQSNSMTSIACLALAGGLLVAVNVFKTIQKPLILHTTIGSIVALAFAVLFLKVGGGALESMGRNPTLTGRTEIWQGLIALTSNSVIGMGYESFWLGDHLKKIWASGELLYGINEAHNAYLEVFLNLGFVGVLSLAALLISGYLSVTRKVRIQRELGSLGLAFFVCALIHGFTESAAFRMMTPIWFGCILAMMIPVERVGTTKRETQDKSLPQIRQWWTPTESRA